MSSLGQATLPDFGMFHERIVETWEYYSATISARGAQHVQQPTSSIATTIALGIIYRSQGNIGSTPKALCDDGLSRVIFGKNGQVEITL